MSGHKAPSKWNSFWREAGASFAGMAIVGATAFGIATLGYYSAKDDLVGVKMTDDQLRDQKDCGLYSDDMKKAFQLATVNASLGKPSLITLPADTAKSCPTPQN